MDRKYFEIVAEIKRKIVKDVEEQKRQGTYASRGALDISATVTAVQIRGWRQVVGILAVAMVRNMPTVYPHFFITLGELLAGYVIGASIGLFMAAVLTQAPDIEKIITPYILLLVTTLTIALVPLLMLRMGFNVWPGSSRWALSVGPMVMINATTRFRRTDLAKIALAKSYGATTFQILRKIRFPLALPMINVGLLVGGTFGLITAVASDMFGGKMGLGNRISNYSSLARMASFFAIILLVSLIGISIWIIMAAVGKKWSSWQK
ncbi:MAG: ABC transporter permease subunit [Spirochaetes bacterium]|nr:ABC transporter permease subunit [Spirochaetota bacterium]